MVLNLERDLGILKRAQLVSGNFFEQFRVVEHLRKAVDGRVTRFICNSYSQIDVGAHVLVDTVEQCPAARQDHSAIVNIGGDLRPKLGQSVFDRLGYSPNYIFYNRIDFTDGDLDGSGAAGLNVTASDRSE